MNSYSPNLLSNVPNYSLCNFNVNLGPTSDKLARLPSGVNSYL